MDTDKHRKTGRIFSLLLLFLLFPLGVALAHPHVFFEVRMEISLGAGKKMEIFYELYATESTSMAMLCEGDEDGDGTMTPEEMAYLHELYGGYFKRNLYFVRVDLGDEIAEAEVKDFTVLERSDKPRHFIICYRAVLDVGMPTEEVARVLHVDLYDKEGYSAFLQKPEHAKVVPTESRVKVKKVKLLPTQAGVAVFYVVEPPAPEASSVEPALPAAVGVTEVAAPTLYARFTAALSQAREKISRLISELATDFSFSVFLGLLGFAVLYGVFHALGPGHGKVLVAAFMMRGSSRPWHAVVLSLVVTISHTGSSILLVLLLKKIFELLFSEKVPKNQMESAIGLVSGIIVAVIGIVLIWRLIREKRAAVSEDKVTVGQVARWGLAVGLVPCPASITFMVVSNSVGLLWVGIVLVLALAVGLSVVLLAVAMLTVYAKRGAATLASRRKGWQERIQTGVAVAGNLLVIGLGLFLVWFHGSGL
jgi:ABC-type nickel/cobalt efflux system permease component RcnA/ABC-type uncharacterized transport system substrate-binding protein